MGEIGSKRFQNMIILCKQEESLISTSPTGSIAELWTRSSPKLPPLCSTVASRVPEDCLHLPFSIWAMRIFIFFSQRPAAYRTSSSTFFLFCTRRSDCTRARRVFSCGTGCSPPAGSPTLFLSPWRTRPCPRRPP